jgi:hypothetical protein
LLLFDRLELRFVILLSHAHDFFVVFVALPKLNFKTNEYFRSLNPAS